MTAETKHVVGAIINDGGVAHIHQAAELPALLGEDEFFEQTGLRLSWPARVAVIRLLREDILLQDVRQLIHHGELDFDGEAFSIADSSMLIAEQKLQRIADAVAVTNEDLPGLLRESRVL